MKVAQTVNSGKETESVQTPIVPGRIHAGTNRRSRLTDRQGKATATRLLQTAHTVPVYGSQVTQGRKKRILRPLQSYATLKIRLFGSE